MRLTAKTLVGITLLALSFSPALARMPFSGVGVNVSPTNYPGAPKPIYDRETAPYAMNYTDEAVQTLGFRNGHLDVFTAKPAENHSYLPAFSGGLGGDGAMLKLQWR